MKREEKPKTWLDGLIGWEPEGNVIETWWCGDPAIDQERSDLEAYKDHLDKSHLVVRHGMTPARVIVRLPTASQYGAIAPHLNSLSGAFTAAVVAFELCVRFPDVAGAEPVFFAGFERLTQPFLRALMTRHPEMVAVLGMWVINRYSLTPDEKKTSSREPTRKISSPQGSTDAEMTTARSSAAIGSSDPTGVQISTPSQPPQSGSAAAAPSTSGGPSTDALARTSVAPVTPAGCQP